MKKWISTSLAAVAVLSLMNGCGGSDGAKEAVKQRAAHKTMAEFDALMRQWKAYGFDVNKTAENSYVLTVAQPKKVTDVFMRAFGLESMDDEAKKELAEGIDGMRFQVKADKEKYVNVQPDSIYVAYLGDGTPKKALAKKLIDEKKLGAYVTLDASDALKKVRFNDIDETYVDANKTTIHLQFKHTVADIDRFSLNAPGKTTLRFVSDLLQADIDDADTNGSMHIGYNGWKCDLDKQNGYLGTMRCSLKRLFVDNTEPAAGDPVHVTVEDITVASDAKASGGLVASTLNFGIKNIGVNNKGAALSEYFDMTLSGLHFDVDGDDFNETVLQSFVALQQNPPKNEEQYMQQTLKLAADLYSRMRFDVTYGLDDFHFTNAQFDMTLKGFEAKGNGAFYDTLTYKEIDRINNIRVSQPKASKPLFAMENFAFGYGVEKLYNFLPDLADVIAKEATADNNATAKVPVDVDKEMGKIATRIVNKGFGLYIDPLGWDRLEATVQQPPLALDALRFNIHAKLEENNVPVDLENPLTGMMLLNALKVNGKLELKQKDLQAVAPLLPPQVGMMLMMFAKQQGDTAVYVIEFKNGVLTVNGQPLM